MLVETVQEISCFHCGNTCQEEDIFVGDKHFCCNGCQTVYEILENNNLCSYYDLNENAGISLKAKNFHGRFDYLADEKIEDDLLEFRNEKMAKIMLYIPSIHCSSCVWLLENFHKIQNGVLVSRLNFVKKELAITYNPVEVKLKTIVELLATLGYEPKINLSSSIANKTVSKISHRLLFQIGVVGFCAGNIMLLSFPEYFGLNLNNKSDNTYHKFFLLLNFLLSLPVYFYGGVDYLKGAYQSIQSYYNKTTDFLSVDIPIALGISALFFRSAYETLILHQAGYWDSLAGLVLFLLLGKWIQKSTFDYLSFDRNYESYFPLAVKMNNEQGYKNVNNLAENDNYLIHSQELIPVDSELINGNALIDYSFVTGESTPVHAKIGEVIYAGGRQLSELIELKVRKKVSTSYLTQLWNNESFIKEKEIETGFFYKIFSKYFTIVVIAIAIITGIYWQIVNPANVWTSITAVFMVACPCALTLSMPFTMHATMRVFAKNHFFVKNQSIIQLLTDINTIVFDKTGTLTEANNAVVHFHGNKLTYEQEKWIKSLLANTLHPVSRVVYNYLQVDKLVKVADFKEIIGRGIIGKVDGHQLKLGSADFIQVINNEKTAIHVEIDNQYIGYFAIEQVFRKDWQTLLTNLKAKFNLHLISGDSQFSIDGFSKYFGNQIKFQQSPQEKLDYIKDLSQNNQKVAMIGDGLNDAGALRAATVGIALTEDVQAFSPSCDAILDAKYFSKIDTFVGFSKTALIIVKLSFLLSVVYNIIGIGWAVSATLSPVKAAIFMPLSSLSVVLFAVGLTFLAAKMKKLI